MLSSFGECVRLAEEYAPGEDAAIDRLDAMYWWLAEHGDGKPSWQHEALRQLQCIFGPSPIIDGPETQLAQDIFLALCEANGCSHGIPEYWPVHEEF